HNAIELYKPVEGLVALLPVLKAPLIVFFFLEAEAVDTILGGEIFVEIGIEGVEFGAELLLALGKVQVCEVEFGLHGAEIFEATLYLFGSLLDAAHRVVEVHLVLEGYLAASCAFALLFAGNAFFDVIVASKADERVARTNVKVN